MINNLDEYIKIEQNIHKDFFIIELELFDYLKNKNIKFTLEKTNESIIFNFEDNKRLSLSPQYFSGICQEFCYNLRDCKALSCSIGDHSHLDEIIIGFYIEFLIFEFNSTITTATGPARRTYEQFFYAKLEEIYLFNKKQKREIKHINIIYLGI